MQVIKAHFKTWIMVIVLAIIYTVIVQKLGITAESIKTSISNKEVLDYTVYFDCGIGAEESMQLLTTKLNSSTLRASGETEADILIVDAGESVDVDLSEYTKYENYFYSPLLVLYEGYNLSNYSDYLTYVNTKFIDFDKHYTKDMKVMLNDILTEKTHGELCLNLLRSDRTKKEKFTFHYFKEDEQLIRVYLSYVLNNYIYPTGDEVAAINKQVDELMGKFICETREAYKTYDIHDKNATNKFYLCFEKEFAHNKGTFDTVAIGQTLCKYLDVYVRTDKLDGAIGVLTNKKFYKKFAYRNEAIGKNYKLFNGGFESYPLIKRTDN